MHAAPMASRAKTKKHTSKVTTGTPKHAGIPCAMALTTYSTLFPATGLFVTVIGAMRSIVANRGCGTRRILPVIWGRDQLRQIGTTGKSRCDSNGPVVPGRCTSICAFSPPWPISKPSDELKPARHVMV